MTKKISMSSCRLKFGINVLYKCFICSLMLMYMLEATAIKGFMDSILHDVLFFTAILFAIVYIIVRKYSVQELLQIGVLNILGIFCFLSSGYTGLFMTMLAITLFPKNKLDEVLRAIFKEEVLIFAGIVLAAGIGIIDNETLAIDKTSYVVTARTLGFGHPNMLAAQATSIILLYLCVNRNHLRGKHIVSAYFFLILFYAASQGRTSLLLGLVAVTFIAVHKKPKVQRIIMRILPWTYVIVLLILAVCMSLYGKLGHNSSIVKVVNDWLFNGRIGLAFRSLLIYPITLFGKPIDLRIWNDWQYYALDNGQVMLLLEYGILGFLGYGWVIQKTLHHIKEENETVLAIVMMTFLVWSMYEGTMYFIGKNFALLFLGTTGFSNKQKRITKGKLSDT